MQRNSARPGSKWKCRSLNGDLRVGINHFRRSGRRAALCNRHGFGDACRGCRRSRESCHVRFRNRRFFAAQRNTTRSGAQALGAYLGNVEQNDSRKIDPAKAPNDTRCHFDRREKSLLDPSHSLGMTDLGPSLGVLCPSTSLRVVSLSNHAFAGDMVFRSFLRFRISNNFG